MQNENTKGVLWGVITPATPVIIPLTSFTHDMHDSPDDDEDGKRGGKLWSPSKIIRDEKIKKDHKLVHRRQRVADKLLRSAYGYKGSHLIRRSKFITYPTFAVNFAHYFANYSVVCRIHGLKYIIENRSFCEKLFWTTVTVMSFLACILIMTILYKEYSDSPIIVTFSYNNKYVFEYPFPAVTICPAHHSEKFDYNEAYRKRRAQETLDPEEFKNFQYLYELCEHKSLTEHAREMTDFDEEHQFHEHFDNLVGLSPTLDNIFLECNYQLEKITNCSSLFNPIIMDKGVCYTSNMVHWKHIFNTGVMHLWKDFHTALPSPINHWDSSLGVYTTSDFYTYPKRAIMSGLPNSLRITLLYPTDTKDGECGTYIQGYKILLHNPMDLPEMEDHFTRVALGSSTNLAVHPKLMMTTTEAANIHPSKRLCFMNSERSLQFYKTYTLHNCESECQSKFYIKMCKCVPFHMPHPNGTKICGGRRLLCLEKAKSTFDFTEFFTINENLTVLFTTQNLRKALHVLEESVKIEECNCLPLCSELYYDIETSQTQWDFDAYLKASIREDIIRPNNTIVTSVNIYITDDYYPAFQRSSLYTKLDLLANIGSFLTLFSGITVITVVELIYYWTLRTYYNYKLHGIWSYAYK